MATGAVRSDIGKNDRWIIGEDKPHQMDVVNGSGTPVDVSSYSLSYELKASKSATTALLTVTESGMTISDGVGTNDRITFTVADTDLEGVTGIAQGWYWQQLRRTDPGNEGVMLEGQVYLHDRGLPSA